MADTSTDVFLGQCVLVYRGGGRYGPYADLQHPKGPIRVACGAGGVIVTVKMPKMMGRLLQFEIGGENETEQPHCERYRLKSDTPLTLFEEVVKNLRGLT